MVIEPLQLSLLIVASALCARAAKRDLVIPLWASLLACGLLVFAGALMGALYAALGLLVVICSFIIETDRRFQLIPDEFVLGLIAIALTFALAGADEALWGAGLIGFVFFAVRQTLSSLRGQEVMGWGDVKFAVAIGALLGPMHGFYAVAMAGAATSVFLVVRARTGALQAGAPFGIGLASATIIVAIAKAIAL
ncbi:A24 family peptidase [Candidatus Viadribacter manganicus]|uniref:Prepilin type IV endopeptidase peptidase domain-containing protein n=1 Tax=Candidatus Viadribacter manganicus TaxID=1759059 RepID=A0A1B1AGQ2_9PROT|nr:A24 family peptidase [Candidatus Viadribacter manganicus]ANP45721.1 hypothetical protein ATE48_07215 [Candidatus Viadribacter manganicus]